MPEAAGPATDEPFGPDGAFIPPELTKSGPYVAAFHSPPARRAVSRQGVMMLVGMFFAVAAIIVMVVVALTRKTKVVVMEAGTGKVLEVRKMGSGDEARDYARGVSSGAIDPTKSPAKAQPPELLGDPARTRAAEASSAQTPGELPEAASQAAPKGDPKLNVEQNIISTVAAAEASYVVGRVKNLYDKPLESVTVTAYVNGLAGPTHTFEYLPAGEAMPYSMSLGMDADQMASANVKVAATGNLAPDSKVVWLVSSNQVLRRNDDNKVTWSGTTTNPTNWAVRDVKVYLDMFSSDGLHYGAATGELQEERSLKAGGAAPFKVVTNDNRAEAAQTVVVRVVGEKF
jgi:hypothetical protein